MRYLQRWPLLLAAALSFGSAVTLLDDSDSGREAAAAALLVAGSILLGAFLVHREHDDEG